MAVPPDFVAGQVLTAAQLNQIGAWRTVTEQTVTTGSSFTRDNVFNADFRNYLLVVTGLNSTGANMALQLRVGGVTASGTNYQRQFVSFDNTTVNSTRATGQTSFNIGDFGASTNAVYVFISNPNVAGRTSIQSYNNYANTTTTPIIQFFSGLHDLSTAYDGFIVTPSSGTFTGNYCVYGLNT
jgi:hypothetical protein